VIYALHSDPAAQPIELTVDDLELILNRALPVMYPDRDELAFKLFRADNSSASIALCIEDFHKQKAEQGEQFYVYPLADAAIEAFRKANP
jgi:hypothetical protein